MGVTILNALFLLRARRGGASFESTLTLGRLDCFMTSTDLRRIERMLPPGTGFADSRPDGGGASRIDQLFQGLGANRVDAMDASAFEGATIVHDLNEPLPPELEGRYDAVVDGGTLEHVFNVPMAFRNVMAALKVGGSFFGKLPANDWCGHGMYQFGPDLLYRVFSPENGFEVVELFVAPAYVAGKWLDGPVFRVADPAAMSSRVEIKSRKETVFLLHARRVADAPIFARWPQQSDYSAAWSGSSAAGGAGAGPHRPSTLRRLAGRIMGFERVFQRWRERRRWSRESKKNPALRPHTWNV